MYTLQLVEEMINLAVSDVRNYCISKPCEECKLPCDKNQAHFTACWVCSYLTNLNIITQDKYKHYANMFMHSTIPQFTLEVYKDYQARG